MRRMVAAFLMCFMLGSVSANGKYGKNSFFCTTDRLKLRENPGLDSNVIAVLDDLTALEFLQEGGAQTVREPLPSGEVAEYCDSWVKVKTVPTQKRKSATGWVYGAYITPLFECGIFSDEKAAVPVRHFFQSHQQNRRRAHRHLFFS